MAQKWYIGGFKSAEVLTSKAMPGVAESKPYVALMSGDRVFASVLICPNHRQVLPC